MGYLDRADWHYNGNFPKGLPKENGATHIGMFLAWAIHRGLENASFNEYAAQALASVRQRQMTGRQFFIKWCDEKFSADDLSPAGADFANAYYRTYLNDYVGELAPGGQSAYHIEDTWETFDRIATLLDRKHAEFLAQRAG